MTKFTNHKNSPKSIILILLALTATIKASKDDLTISEIHSIYDFRSRLSEHNLDKIHSIWLTLEAKWCPLSKNGMKYIKDGLEDIDANTILLRIDW